MFYDRFLALCKARNVKPTAVADAIGISKTNASFWKKGSIPSSTNLQKLADYFDVPLTYLLGTHDSVTVVLDNESEAKETISDAEIERDKIVLDNLLNEIDTIPKQHRADAIHEMTAMVQFVLHKYKTMVPESSFIGP